MKRLVLKGNQASPVSQCGASEVSLGAIAHPRIDNTSEED